MLVVSRLILSTVQLTFSELFERGAGLGVAEAYGTFNMGAGLALFAAAGHGEA